MVIDDLAYLDQLYAEANAGDHIADGLKRSIARDKFVAGVMKLWPEISRAFDDLKHSL